jgi:transcriptional regulator with XRE-family HTH domain
MSNQEWDDDHPAKRLGKKLREARIAAGYRSQGDFAVLLPLHRTAVTKIETGNRHIAPDLLERWCEICHVDYELFEAGARLAWVAETAPVPDWFADFRKAQTLAHTIRTWNPVNVPGPLQVPGYARALYEATGTPAHLIDERVRARIELQQETIDRSPVPVTLIAVMDESVLYRRARTPGVMHAQLLHLAEQAQRPHIGVQVVPARHGVNAGNVGAFTIASIEDANVMLMETVEDVTTDKRATIRGALAIFDRVRLDARSQEESLELITKAAESCRP